MLIRNKVGREKILEKFENTGYRLQFIGKGKHRNAVGIMFNKKMKKNIVDNKLGDI